LARGVLREPPGPAFNSILAATARYQLILSALVSIGISLG
jgi:hypothetical protein